MKRKLSYLLIIFISMFMYGGVEAENISKGTCTYNVGDVSLVVTQNGEDNIITTISGSDSTNVFKGASFDKSKSTIEKDDFYPAGSFKCSNVYACKFEDTMNANVDGTVSTRWSLESDSNVKCIDKKSYSGKMKNALTCTYDNGKYLAGGGDKCVVEVTEGSGNTLSIKKKKCSNVTVNLKADYYYDNGSFKCAKGIWGYETLYEGVIVYTLANSSEDIPNNGFETIVGEPEEPIVDDGKEDHDDDEQFVTDDETLKILMRIYDIIKILIPVLIIVLSTVDFLKVVIYDDEKNYKSAFDKLVKRLVIGVVFFLLPILISFVLKYSGLDIEQSYLEIFK